jgi:hypothetical protein
VLDCQRIDWLGRGVSEVLQGFAAQRTSLHVAAFEFTVVVFLERCKRARGKLLLSLRHQPCGHLLLLGFGGLAGCLGGFTLGLGLGCCCGGFTGLLGGLLGFLLGLGFGFAGFFGFLAGASCCGGIQCLAAGFGLLAGLLARGFALGLLLGFAGLLRCGFTGLLGFALGLCLAGGGFALGQHLGGLAVGSFAVGGLVADFTPALNSGGARPEVHPGCTIYPLGFKSAVIDAGRVASAGQRGIGHAGPALAHLLQVVFSLSSSLLGVQLCAQPVRPDFSGRAQDVRVVVSVVAFFARRMDGNIHCTAFAACHVLGKVQGQPPSLLWRKFSRQCHFVLAGYASIFALLGQLGSVPQLFSICRPLWRTRWQNNVSGFDTAPARVVVYLAGSVIYDFFTSAICSGGSRSATG